LKKSHSVYSFLWTKSVAAPKLRSDWRTSLENCDKYNSSESLAPNKFKLIHWLKATFWKRSISSVLNRAFPGSFGYFFGFRSPSKNRGILVHKNSLAFYQRYGHSVESRALSCAFKQSNLSAWSLVSWHPTHTYPWAYIPLRETLFIQVVCCSLSRSRRVLQIMPTESLLFNAALELFSPSMNWMTE